MKISFFITLLLSVLIFTNAYNVQCEESKESIIKTRSEIKGLNFETYRKTFDPVSPLISRIGNRSEVVLDFLKEFDNREDYKLYSLSSDEKKMVKKDLDLLPKGIKKALRKKLIGIYFIDNFLGNGFTEYIADFKNNEVYVIFVFNSSLFKKNISKMLSDKENSIFIDNDVHIKVEVDCGNEMNGFMFILLHESVHAYDYVKRLTSYTEKSIETLFGKKESDFSKNIWVNYNKPVVSYDYPLRKEITFYGMNDGPKINVTEAKKLYVSLQKTPFVSVYSSLSWAEDLADLVAFYHLTQNTGLSYKIRVINNKKVILEYEPMKSLLVKKRLDFIKKNIEF